MKTIFNKVKIIILIISVFTISQNLFSLAPMAVKPKAGHWLNKIGREIFFNTINQIAKESGMNGFEFSKEIHNKNPFFQNANLITQMNPYFNMGCVSALFQFQNINNSQIVGAAFILGNEPPLDRNIHKNYFEHWDKYLALKQHSRTDFEALLDELEIFYEKTNDGQIYFITPDGLNRWNDFYKNLDKYYSTCITIVNFSMQNKNIQKESRQEIQLILDLMNNFFSNKFSNRSPEEKTQIIFSVITDYFRSQLISQKVPLIETKMMPYYGGPVGSKSISVSNHYSYISLSVLLLTKNFILKNHNEDNYNSFKYCKWYQTMQFTSVLKDWQEQGIYDLADSGLKRQIYMNSGFIQAYNMFMDDVINIFIYNGKSNKLERTQKEYKNQFKANLKQLVEGRRYNSDDKLKITTDDLQNKAYKTVNECFDIFFDFFHYVMNIGLNYDLSHGSGLVSHVLSEDLNFLNECINIISVKSKNDPKFLKFHKDLLIYKASLQFYRIGYSSKGNEFNEMLDNLFKQGLPISSFIEIYRSFILYEENEQDTEEKQMYFEVYKNILFENKSWDEMKMVYDGDGRLFDCLFFWCKNWPEEAIAKHPEYPGKTVKYGTKIQIEYLENVFNNDPLNASAAALEIAYYHILRGIRDVKQKKDSMKKAQSWFRKAFKKIPKTVLVRSNQTNVGYIPIYFNSHPVSDSFKEVNRLFAFTTLILYSRHSNTITPATDLFDPEKPFHDEHTIISSIISGELNKKNPDWTLILHLSKYKLFLNDDEKSNAMDREIIITFIKHGIKDDRLFNFIISIMGDGNRYSLVITDKLKQYWNVEENKTSVIKYQKTYNLIQEIFGSNFDKYNSLNLIALGKFYFLEGRHKEAFLLINKSEYQIDSKLNNDTNAVFTFPEIFFTENLIVNTLKPYIRRYEQSKIQLHKLIQENAQEWLNDYLVNESETKKEDINNILSKINNELLENSEIKWETNKEKEGAYNLINLNNYPKLVFLNMILKLYVLNIEQNIFALNFSKQANILGEYENNIKYWNDLFIKAQKHENAIKIVMNQLDLEKKNFPEAINLLIEKINQSNLELSNIVNLHRSVENKDYVTATLLYDQVKKNFTQEFENNAIQTELIQLRNQYERNKNIDDNIPQSPISNGKKNKKGKIKRNTSLASKHPNTQALTDFEISSEKRAELFLTKLIKKLFNYEMTNEVEEFENLQILIEKLKEATDNYPILIKKLLIPNDKYNYNNYLKLYNSNDKLINKLQEILSIKINYQSDIKKYIQNILKYENDSLIPSYFFSNEIMGRIVQILKLFPDIWDDLFDDNEQDKFESLREFKNFTDYLLNSHKDSIKRMTNHFYALENKMHTQYKEIEKSKKILQEILKSLYAYDTETSSSNPAFNFPDGLEEIVLKIKAMNEKYPQLFDDFSVLFDPKKESDLYSYYSQYNTKALQKRLEELSKLAQINLNNATQAFKQLLSEPEESLDFNDLKINILGICKLERKNYFQFIENASNELVNQYKKHENSLILISKNDYKNLDQTSYEAFTHLEAASNFLLKTIPNLKTLESNNLIGPKIQKIIQVYTLSHSARTVFKLKVDRLALEVQIEADRRHEEEFFDTQIEYHLRPTNDFKGKQHPDEVMIRLDVLDGLNNFFHIPDNIKQKELNIRLNKRFDKATRLFKPGKRILFLDPPKSKEEKNEKKEFKPYPVFEINRMDNKERGRIILTFVNKHQFPNLSVQEIIDNFINETGGRLVVQTMNSLQGQWSLMNKLVEQLSSQVNNGILKFEDTFENQKPMQLELDGTVDNTINAILGLSTNQNLINIENTEIKHDPSIDKKLEGIESNNNQKKILAKILSIIKSINTNAFQRVFFIQAPGGTGKTHTLTLLNKLILFVFNFMEKIGVGAPTHVAVDNVVLFHLNKIGDKIKNKLIRLANSIHQEDINPAVKLIWDYSIAILKDECLKKNLANIHFYTLTGFSGDERMNELRKNENIKNLDETLKRDVLHGEEAAQGSLSGTLYFVVQNAKTDAVIVLWGDQMQLRYYGIDENQMNFIREMIGGGKIKKDFNTPLFYADVDLEESLFQPWILDVYSISPLEWMHGKINSQSSTLDENHRSVKMITKLLNIFYKRQGLEMKSVVKTNIPEHDQVLFFDTKNNQSDSNVLLNNKEGRYIDLEEIRILLEQIEKDFQNYPTINDEKFTGSDITFICPYKAQIKIFTESLYAVALLGELNKLINNESKIEDLTNIEEAIKNFENLLLSFNPSFSGNIVNKLRTILIDKTETINENIINEYKILLNDTIFLKGWTGTHINLQSIKGFQTEELTEESNTNEDTENVGGALTIHTIQGKQNNAIYISLVNNNEKGRIGFFNKKNGKNMIITSLGRAKHMLRIAGNSKTWEIAAKKTFTPNDTLKYQYYIKMGNIVGNVILDVIQFCNDLQKKQT